MKKIILTLLSVSLFFVSCTKDDDVPCAGDNEQTVFMYLPWSTDLESYFENNISDFAKALQNNILKNERIVVFFAASPTEATLFELKYKKGKNTRTTLKEYKNPACTTAEGITSILNDVKSFAPAQRYAMIIGCHGMGWLPVSSSRALDSDHRYHWEYEGGLLTRFFGGLSKEYQTDVTSLAKGIADAGIKMEYILFDDCYMSSIEVAYDLKDVTDYLIASPTEIMAYGMPYHLIGEHLVGRVNYQGVCDSFYSFYMNNDSPYATIGVTKCSELESLASVMKEINQKYSFNPALLNQVQRLDGYTPIIFFDYGDYVAKLCPDPVLLDRFKNQLNRTVPSELSKHTPLFYSMVNKKLMKIDAYSGVTVSDPSINSLALVPKTETAWYKATH